MPVWKAAIELAEKIYALTEKPPFRYKYSFRDHLERAALSVSNNISEGFEQGTTQELLTFLYIARGSAGEVRSMVCFIERLPTFQDLKLFGEGISRQLRGWADFLQNTEIKGQRYLNEKERIHTQTKRQREEFLELLKRYQKNKI